MPTFLTSNMPVDARRDHMLDPFDCRDRAQSLRSETLRHLARLISEDIRRGLASRSAMLFGSRAY